MNKIQKWIQKDKYGIYRGSLFLGLLIVICLGLFIGILPAYDRTAEKERAADAALHVVSEFEQLIESGFEQMNGAASLLDADTGEGAILEALCEYGPFSDAGIVLDGEIRRSDGSVARIGDETSYIHYDATSQSTELIAQSDGRIQLRVSLEQAGELAAWLDPARVDAALRSAFSEDYGYALYNASTGSYLLNETNLSGAGYYDALLELNDGGGVEGLLDSATGQARITLGSGEKAYIAQRESAIRPWNVALIVPAHLVRAQGFATARRQLFVVTAAVVLLGVLIAYTAHSLRRIRMANNNARRALEMDERLVNTAAMEAKATLYVHRRGQDVLLPCHDGMGLIGGLSNGVKFTTMSGLIAACGLDEEDTERLQERMRELAPGESAELVVHSLAREREDHALRFALSVPADDAEAMIINIHDCTLQMLSRDRADEERDYRAAIEAKTASIWQVNLSRNRWRAVYAKDSRLLREMGISLNQWLGFESLNEELRGYVHPLDWDVCTDAMRLSNINSTYRSGNMQLVREYRVRGGEDGYIWHRMTVHFCLDPDAGDTLANVYVFDVDAEKNAELERGERKRILSQTLTALGGIYYGLYYVDLDRDLCYTAKDHGGELVSQLCAPFKATFDTYIDSIVHPDDREELRKMIDVYRLHKSMKEGSHYQSHSYRRLSGDGYHWCHLIIQPARFENGDVREVVLALSSEERRDEDET